MVDSKSLLDDISKVQVEQWDINDVKPYPFNNKKHPEKQIDLLMRSIKAHGHLDPIVVDEDGVIISGHGRREALVRLGREKVAVRVLRGISEAEASALRIAANKTVSNEYDTDALARELSFLNDLDMDLGALGFDEKELSMLISDVGEIDDDMIVADMTAAVEQHEAEINEKAEDVDQDMVRLDRAFGFKTIPLKDQKYVARFLAEIEAEYELPADQALIKHMINHLAGLG